MSQTTSKISVRCTRYRIIALGMVGVIARQATAAEFLPLQSLDGTVVATRSSAMTDDGSIVVGSVVGTSYYEPYLWTRDLGVQVLEPIGVGRYKVDITPDGTLVAWEPEIHSHWTHTWSVGNGVVPIEPGVGIMMSESGSVIAGNSCCIPRRWTPQNGVEELGWPSSVTNRVRTISTDGEVLVGIHRREPVRWSESTGLSVLGTVPGQVNHVILGASLDASVIYGLSEATTSTNYFINDGGLNTLWRWTESEGIIVLESGSGDERGANRFALSDTRKFRFAV